MLRNRGLTTAVLIVLCTCLAILTAGGTARARSLAGASAALSAHDDAADEPTVLTFDDPGNEDFLVPDGVTSVTADVYGAQGWSNNTVLGGKGAYVSGTIAVSPGEELTVGVGGQTPLNQYQGAVGYVVNGLNAEGGYSPATAAPVAYGGGGSGVGTRQAPLIVAGGGGSAGAPTATDDGGTEDIGAAGAGGNSGHAGDDGDPVSDSVTPNACTDAAGGGGEPGTAIVPGDGGGAGRSDCPGMPTTQGATYTQVVYQGDPGIAGDTKQVGAGGSGQDSGYYGGTADVNTTQICGGGGGGGYHGGGGGGTNSGSADSVEGTEGEFSFFSGCGGGGGGSDFVDPSVTDSSVDDGFQEGDGEVVLTYTQVGPDITSGPDQDTNETSATFEFTEDTAGDNTDECSLDGAPYSACTSPLTYTGLADGAHTFDVRQVDVTDDRSEPSSWEWTVDTHQPVVTIDSAPTGTGNSPAASITFHSDTAGVAFTCALDGAAAQPCDSPYTVGGLADGQHTLAISATDELGNVSAAPATASWTVGGTSSTATTPAGATTPTSSTPGSTTAPGTTATPAPSTGPPSGCTTTATRGSLVLIGTGGTCLTSVGGMQWTTTHAVTLNGITVTPDAGTTLTLGGSATIGTFNASGPTTVGIDSLGSVHVTVPIAWSEDATGSLISAVKSYSIVQGSVAGLPAVPSTLPAITFSSDNGGSAKIAQQISLPAALSALPGSPEKITAELDLSTSNTSGLQIGGEIAVSSLYLGALHLEDLKIAYDAQAAVFNGSVAIQLGAAGPTLATAITIGPPSGPTLFAPCCLQKLSLVVQKINKPIPETPLFLQSIGGSAMVTGSGASSTVTIGGTVGLSLGPEIPDIGPAVSFEGGLSLAISDPWVLEATGQASVFSFPLANAKATYTFGQGVTLSGTVDATLAGYGLKAAIENSFFQGTSAFNIAASGDVSFPILGSEHAAAVFSSQGFAACASIHTAVGDYAIGWGVLASTSQPIVLEDTCDLGPFTATPTPAVPAFASQARIGEQLTARSLSLSGPAREHAIAIHGVGGAPTVTVTGPHGITVTGGPNHSAPEADGIVLPDPAGDVTYAVLARAPAGEYTIHASGYPVSAVTSAGALPAVRVNVHTTALRDGRRRLTWSQKASFGQHLELYEDGNAQTGRRLVRTTHTHGSLIYTPAPGLGTHRAILALTVGAAGLPRARTVLAPYASTDQPPRQVTRLHQTKQTLIWSGPSGARSYAIAFSVPTGTVTLTVRRPRIIIPAGAIRVTVVAIDAIGRAGKARTLRLHR